MTWDWNFAASILPILLRGLIVTVEATILATMLAMVIGLPIAIAKRSPKRFVSLPVRYAFEAIRRTPLLIQLYCLYYVLPDVGIVLSPLVAGVVGLGMHYASYTSEVYRAGIEGVPKPQWEGARALNIPPFNLWVRIILPQALPPVIPALGNNMIAMFKESAVLYAITVVELMNSARTVANQSYRYFEPMTMVGLLFILVSLPAAVTIRRLERRFKQKHS